MWYVAQDRRKAKKPWITNQPPNDKVVVLHIATTQDEAERLQRRETNKQDAWRLVLPMTFFFLLLVGLIALVASLGRVLV